MKILLKITSRQRAHQCQKTVLSWLLNADHSDEIICAYSLDVDDPELTLYHLSILNGHCTAGENKTKIEAINAGVPDCEWDILVNVSDDQICVMKGWDTQLKKLFTLTTDLSIWAPDGVQPMPNRINTQEIIGREYYKRTGFIYDPRFKSFFCDNLSTEVAAFLDRQVIIKTPICRHDHQAAAHIQTPMDLTALKNNGAWRHDEEMYNSLKIGGISKYLLDLKA